MILERNSTMSSKADFERNSTMQTWLYGSTRTLLQIVFQNAPSWISDFFGFLIFIHDFHAMQYSSKLKGTCKNIFWNFSNLIWKPHLWQICHNNFHGYLLGDARPNPLFLWQKTGGCIEMSQIKTGFWAWWFVGREICGAWNFKFHAPQIIMPKGPHSHLEHPHNSVHGSSFLSFLWQLLTRCPGAGIRLADRSSDLGATWVTFLSGLETYWGAEYVYWYWCAVIRDYDGYWSSQADLVSMWCHASRSSWSWWMSFDK